MFKHPAHDDLIKLFTIFGEDEFKQIDISTKLELGFKKLVIKKIIVRTVRDKNKIWSYKINPFYVENLKNSKKIQLLKYT